MLQLVVDNPHAPPPSAAERVIRRLQFARSLLRLNEDAEREDAFAEISRKLEVAIDILKSREERAS